VSAGEIEPWTLTIEIDIDGDVRHYVDDGKGEDFAAGWRVSATDPRVEHALRRAQAKLAADARTIGALDVLPFEVPAMTP